MKKKLLTLFLTFILWLVFAGRINLPVVIVGLIVCFLVSLIFAEKMFRMLTMDYGLKKFFKKIYYIILIIGAFLYDVFESAVKVSRHAFEINPSFSPGIVRLNTSLESITGITILSNLITLTPGTLVMDFDISDKDYYIHSLDVDSEDEAETKKEIIGKHEDWIKFVFD